MMVAKTLIGLMIDPALFRHAIDSTAANLRRRGYTLDVAHITHLEQQRKQLQVAVQQLQEQRNTQSKKIGQLTTQGKPTQALQSAVAVLVEQLKQNNQALQQCQQALENIYLGIPNLLHEDVPDGTSEQANQEIRHWGTIPAYPFTPLEHHLLAQQSMDFETSALLTGSRFMVLRHELAQLHRALGQWMLDVHTKEHGYTEYYVPFMVSEQTLTASGHLPKFHDDLFQLNNGWYLIPTAEVPLVNCFRGQRLKQSELPVKVVAHTPCFRSEAGSYGKDTHGMLRQHQFEKVELVWLTDPEASYACLEQMVQHAEVILQRLELPYRVVMLCAGDTGFSAAKTYDLEVWLPGQQRYREISSCSNCESFQARRMKTRYYSDHHSTFVHTLNGSGVAIGRALIALLENHQLADGRVHIPNVLQPYMTGKPYLFEQA